MLTTPHRGDLYTRKPLEQENNETALTAFSAIQQKIIKRIPKGKHSNIPKSSDQHCPHGPKFPNPTPDSMTAPPLTICTNPCLRKIRKFIIVKL